MSISNFINISLEASFEKYNILTLLENAKILGCVFYFQNSNIYQESAQEITIDQAANQLEFNRNCTILTCKSIMAIYNQTNFFICITKIDSSTLKFSMGAFCESNKKEFTYCKLTHHIDYATYIKLALGICNKFIIKKFETEVL